jgi:hypothetical protein
MHFCLWCCYTVVASKGSKRVYRLFQLVALSTLLSLVVTFTLRNEALLAAWNKPFITKRLLQFSPTHTEWVPTTALDYLLSLRSGAAPNATPVFTARKPRRIEG